MPGLPPAPGAAEAAPPCAASPAVPPPCSASPCRPAAPKLNMLSHTASSACSACGSGRARSAPSGWRSIRPHWHCRSGGQGRQARCQQSAEHDISLAGSDAHQQASLCTAPPTSGGMAASVVKSMRREKWRRSRRSHRASRSSAAASRGASPHVGRRGNKVNGADTEAACTCLLTSPCARPCAPCRSLPAASRAQKARKHSRMCWRCGQQGGCPVALQSRWQATYCPAQTADTAAPTPHRHLVGQSVQHRAVRGGQAVKQQLVHLALNLVALAGGLRGRWMAWRCRGEPTAGGGPRQ